MSLFCIGCAVGLFVGFFIFGSLYCKEVGHIDSGSERLDLDLIKARYDLLRSNGIARPIPMGLPHAKLIEDLGVLISEIERSRS